MVHESRALGLATVALRQVLQIREISPALPGKCGVFLEHRLVDGGRQRSGPDRKGVDRRIARDDGRIFESVDQLATHLRILWCDELQPQARQPRRQHRHRDHEPPQAPLPGILLHDSAIRHPVRSADLENPRACRRKIHGRRQIGDHIGDGDRLRGRGQPRRADHHRQPFHQRPHQIERKTPGPDHDRRPEFHHIEPAGPQDRSHFVTAPQVRREPIIFSTQTAQIDDATHAGCSGRGRKPLGRQPVGPLEIDAALHRVNEPVGHVDAIAGPREHLGIGRVAGHDLGARCCQTGEFAGPTSEAPHGVTARLELFQQHAPHVACRAGEENSHEGEVPKSGAAGEADHRRCRRSAHGSSTSKARSMSSGLPVLRPYRNHRTRCSLVPCVKASGTT